MYDKVPTLVVHKWAVTVLQEIRMIAGGLPKVTNLLLISSGDRMYAGLLSQGSLALTFYFSESW